MRWLARDEEALPAGLLWLTPAEATRAARLRHPKRRTEYLLRRLAGKHAVAAVLGLPVDPAGLARIEVANAPSGAPYAMVDGAPAGVEISLTDRAGRAVCVVDTGPVGCDLEVVEPRSPAFVNDFLTGPERAYVTGRPDADARDAAANLVWSAKESALKVLRTGLRRDTRSVAVAIQDGPPGAWAPLTVRAVEGTVFHGWWRRDGQFLFTVAAPQPGPPPVALEPAAGLGGSGPGPAAS
ncbi:MAG TPA: 4'-phosphopantetheinyl transferase superfamily protein [Micromonosporaceae bacterium]|nr:4'-phosphopantetheinyl transferase superfamily protein [Micromonosporaceae bacterium]